MSKKSSESKAKKSASASKKAEATAPVSAVAKTAQPSPAETAEMEESEQQAELAVRKRPFPIVGIGASAGGLEAFTHLLQHLSTDTGMGFVLVQHLDPAHGSSLPGLLSKASNMPVIEVENGMRVEPNHVYVIPPNVSLSIVDGELRLEPRSTVISPHRVIDGFFQSLAEDQKSQAIGVILSGTASDGTLGLEAIKAEGGITFSQDEKSARYDGMPRSAIASGCVDFILNPQEIARELVRLSRHPYVVPKIGEAEGMPEDADGFKRILGLLRAIHGVDFSAYKASTLRRRMNRRMALNKIEHIRDYQRFLRSNRGEVDALFQDMLINVTSFFRDLPAFDLLKTKVFPKLVREHAPDEPLRIWVVGCSYGQEAYSVAMSYLEAVDPTRHPLPVQIFATDLSDVGLDKARIGFYPKAVAEEVSPERLRRFFVEVEGGYRVNKMVREMCLFAKHNLLSDPPFSRLDLISCRNLLIYLESEVQRKIVPMFHYALRPGGFLWLGTSESTGTFHDLFSSEDRKYKIFTKKMVPFRHPFAMPAAGHGHLTPNLQAVDKGAAATVARTHVDAQREADRLLLAKFAPAGALINADMEIIQFRGDTGPYLKPAPGKPSTNLLNFLREGLLLPVRAAIQKAKKENVNVRKTDLRVKQNGGLANVDVEVIPVRNLPTDQIHFLVLFETPSGLPVPTTTIVPSVTPKKKAPKAETEPTEVDRTRTRRLEQELADTKDYLQSVTEQYDAALEELQSATEEAQSANEELQSINEELETSKEELQATNEELTTVNQELNARNLELQQFHNDLINLLNSVGIPMVILGPDLRIRRVTAISEKLLNVIPSDIGRSINDIKLKVEIPDLENMLINVIDEVTTREMEVRDKDGRWYLLRIRPYKTLENKIEGAVLMLLDVAERQLLQRAQQQKELYQFADTLNRATSMDVVWQAAVNALMGAFGAERAAILLMEGGHMRFKASRGLSHEYQQAVDGHNPWPASERDPKPICVPNIVESQYPEPLRRAIQKEGIAAIGFIPLVYQGRLLGKLVIYYNGSHTFGPEELQLAQTIAAQLAFAMDRKRGADDLHQAREELAQRANRLQDAVAARTAELSSSNQQLEAFAYSIAHDLRAPLRSMQGFTEMLLEEVGNASQEAKDYAHRIHNSAKFMDSLLMDLLSFSQISQQELALASVKPEAAVGHAITSLEKQIEETNAQIEVVGPWPRVRAQEQTLSTLLQNLISNAIKFVGAGVQPKVRIWAEPKNEIVRIWIEDNGIGIAPEDQEKIFRIFARVHGENYPGTGLGLAIVQKGVERLGGRVGVESTLGQGSRFWIELPKG